MRFQSRQAAGKALAAKHTDIRSGDIVFGIPTGGCVVALELGCHNHTRTHALVTRKIGAPRNPELAIGAVGPDGSHFVDRRAVSALQLTEAQVQQRLKDASDELTARVQLYGRHIVPTISLRGKRVHVVDDGIATGHSVMAAVRYLKARHVDVIYVIAPVASPEAERELRYQAEVITLTVPDDFMAVGQYYTEFQQLTDTEVLAMLNEQDVGSEPVADG